MMTFENADRHMDVWSKHEICNEPFLLIFIKEAVNGYK